MKNRITALILCILLSLCSVPANAAFSDISDTETATAAAALEGLGIVSGTGGSKFEPKGTLTRAQMCKLAVTAMGLSEQVGTYSRRTLFSDVSSGAWYNGYINLAYNEGIVNGCGNGMFNPNGYITYGQLATMLLRMLGYKSADIGSLWPYDYTDYCDSLGLSDGLYLSPMKNVTRGEAAVLLYRALKENSKGTNKPYYESINGVMSTASAIFLDSSASHGGSDGLLMVYSTEQNGGIEYYTQSNAQSSYLVGSMGKLLFNGSGKVMGFIPDGSDYKDVVIGSANASSVTDERGVSTRISSGAKVLFGGSATNYSSGGYTQINSASGKTVRLYYDDSGSVTCLYIMGGTSASSSAAVASTSASAGSALARALGISGTGYSITKNGAAASSDALAMYDVGYYDSASGTLRVSDYRVTGFVTAASPSMRAAETLTVSGCSLDVLESAWDTLSAFSLGDKVTLLLTDDCKVAAAYSPTVLSADMTGVMSKDGKMVTLAGSGITLSASSVNCDVTLYGSLVNVAASSSTVLRCVALSGSGAALNITERTLGSYKLAPSVSVYEWAGSGYVYDTEGKQGAYSTDFTELDGIEKLTASSVSYYHLNSAGQVDTVLLNDVTGNAYTYGRLSTYSADNGVTLGSGTLSASNASAAITNNSGTSAKYICSLSCSDTYVGAAVGQRTSAYGQVVKLKTLKALTGIKLSAFYSIDDDRYAEAGGAEYPISDNVEIYVESGKTWLSGTDALFGALSDSSSATLYVDYSSQTGGQVRIVVVK